MRMWAQWPINDQQALLDARSVANVAVGSFRDFVQRVNPGLLAFEHVRVLVDVLQRVADGKIDRLMVFAPPRHFKSETVSRLFSAYYLLRYPRRWVGLNSYAAELAYTLSRNARDYYQRAGGKFNPDKTGVEQWETNGGGGLWAAGVGGGITGKGFDLGIIDDPLKNAEEAVSKTVREKQKDWYRSTFYTRMSPGAATVVIQTRWFEDDLSGWLLIQEGGEDDEPERWHIVNLPAIAEKEVPSFPATCTMTAEFRRPGEALCPSRYDLQKLAKLRKRIGPYFFNALYQQRPGAAEGTIFKRHWWRFWYPRGTDLPPVRVRMADGSLHECVTGPISTSLQGYVQSWDMAFKGNSSSSFVVGQVWAYERADRYLMDQIRGHLDLPETIHAVRSLGQRWPQANAKLIEDRANGAAVIQSLRREITGLIPVTPETSKEARGHAAAPSIESGNVYLPHPHIAPWVNDFIEELTSFPFGMHDDQADAMTQVLNRLNQPVRQKPTSREN